MPSEAPRLRSDTPNALLAGTRLGEYELLSLLGVGGFGIVYLAFDHALEREVAIKEYMPASLAGRTETMRVSLRSQSDAESFALGLRSFVNEAKLLARFDHPSLLKVHRFWEANGTAYMAMPVMRGRTVKEIRHDMAGAPDEAWCRRILMPLLGAIEKLHSEGVYHRDIAPDNIQIEPDGSPVLLDFGAARRVLSDKSQALTAILKPAYAPIEQYGEAGAVKQGPWTDIYALGATLHYLLLGHPPSPATARTVHDEASNLTPEHLPGCSAAFLHTIDWMLCPRPTDRPQSVAELRDVLEGRARPPVRRAVESAPVHWERTSVLPHPEGEGRIDLDVGDSATQFYARPAPTTPPMPTTPTLPAAATPAPPAGTTEHVWIEPERAPPGAAAPASKAAVDLGPAVEAPDSLIAERAWAVAAPGAAAPGRRGMLKPLALAAVVALAVFATATWWLGQSPIAAVSAPSVLPPAAGPVATPAADAARALVPAPAPLPAASASTAPATATAIAPAPTPDATLPEAPTAAAAPASQGAAAAGTPAAAAMPSGEPVKTVEVSAAPAPGARAPVLPRANAGARPSAEAVKQRAEPTLPARVPPLVPPAAEPAAAGPAPACGPRAGVRYHVCMERECGRADFSSHPACLSWKQEAR